MIRRLLGSPGRIAAACVTAIVWPATRSVAVRGEGAVFAAIEKAAAPAPDPEPVSVIQVAAVHEDHAHPDCAVTAIVPLLAAAAPAMVLGFTANVQAAAASVTERSCCAGDPTNRRRRAPSIS